mgnify:CR=1
MGLFKDYGINNLQPYSRHLVIPTGKLPKEIIKLRVFIPLTLKQVLQMSLDVQHYNRINFSVDNAESYIF